jgi:hypothetical protein
LDKPLHVILNKRKLACRIYVILIANKEFKNIEFAKQNNRSIKQMLMYVSLVYYFELFWIKVREIQNDSFCYFRHIDQYLNTFPPSSGYTYMLFNSMNGPLQLNDKIM